MKIGIAIAKSIILASAAIVQTGCIALLAVGATALIADSAMHANSGANAAALPAMGRTLEYDSSEVVESTRRKSPDGKHEAFWVCKNPRPDEKARVAAGLVDGKVRAAAFVLSTERTIGCFFSPDSAHAVFWINRDTPGCILWLDGKEIRHDGGLLSTSPTLSPSGQTLAYVLHRKSDDCLALNGKEVAKYHSIDGKSLVFSPDSQHVACLGQDLIKRPSGLYEFITEGEEVTETYWFGPSRPPIIEDILILDGSKVSHHESYMLLLIFTADSSELVYWASDGGENRQMSVKVK